MYPKEACSPRAQCRREVVVDFVNVVAESVQDATHGRHVEEGGLGGAHDVLQQIVVHGPRRSQCTQEQRQGGHEDRHHCLGFRPRGGYWWWWWVI